MSPSAPFLIALFALTMLIAAVFAIATGAHAEQPQATCAPRTELVQRLAGEFQEKTVAAGLVDNGAAVVELLVSPDGATWTLLFSLPSGVSCLLSSGDDWRALPPHLAQVHPAT